MSQQRLSVAGSRLRSLITGYMGYDQPSDRLHSDKMFKKFSHQKFLKLTPYLDSIPPAELAGYQEKLENLISKTRKKLDTIDRSMNDFSESFSTDYSRNDSMESKEKIYQFECSIIDNIEEIKQELIILLHEAMDRHEIEESFLKIQTYIDNINQQLFEREAILAGETNEELI